MLLAALLLAPSPIDVALLQSRVRALEAGLRRARIGVAVKDLATGASWSYRGGERFPMQSVFKLPLGMAVLRAVDRGELRLDQTLHVRRQDLSVPVSTLNEEVGRAGKSYSVRRLLELAIGTSDNSAADVLMRRFGGPRRLTAELAGAGIRGIRVDRYERELQPEVTGIGKYRPSLATEEGFVAALNAVPRARRVAATERYLRDPRDTATPRGMMDYLGRLQAGEFLRPATQAVLMRIAIETRTGQNRLKAGLPRGTVLAHKTGTGRTIEGRASATNDVGVATLPGGRKLVLVAFVAGAAASEAQRERAIADFARAAVEAIR
jgi:beta-lactamase class A